MTSPGWCARLDRILPRTQGRALGRCGRLLNAALLAGATAACFAAPLAAFPSAAQAATTWTVTSTGDSVGAECPNPTRCTLRAAINDAHAGDTIVLGAGTYALEQGELEVENKNLTIKGAGAGATTLTTTAPDRLLLVVDSRVTLSGIRFSGGRAAYPGGGALYVIDAVAKISDCAFTNDKDEGASPGEGGQGGAIGVAGDVTISGSSFSGDEALGGTGATGGVADGGGRGGAIFEEDGEVNVSSDTFTGDTAAGGATDSATSGRAVGGSGGAIFGGNGELAVSDSAFSGNVAAGGGTSHSGKEGAGGGEGGALDLQDGSAVIAASTFAANTAGAGADGSGTGYGNGGVGGALSNGGTMSLTASSVTENLVADDAAGFNGGEGGGILSDGTTRIAQSTIAANHAPLGRGGGIFASSSGLRLSQTTVGPTNFARWGGGVYVTEFAEGYAVNSTIADNTATSVGGGILSEGPTALASDTVADNAAEASEGGGNLAAGFADVEMTDTLIADGTAPVGDGNCAFASATALVVSEGFNAENADECELTGPGDRVNANLALGPLENNGGPTETIALLAGSAAIEAGNPAHCAESEGNPVLVDQRGVARPQGARCSIGAFEYVPPPPRDSGLALAPRTFAPKSRGGSIASADAAKHGGPHRGTTVRYRDSEAGSTTFEVLRLQSGYRKGRSCKALAHATRPKHTRACTIETSVGSFSRSDRAGANSFAFTGRIGGRGLPAGQYRLAAKPRYYAVAGRSTDSARFTIV